MGITRTSFMHSKRMIIWGALSILIAAGFVIAWSNWGCQAALELTLELIGDVERTVTLPGPDQLCLERVSVNGRSYSGVPVSQMLEHAGAAEPTRLTFVGDDSHMASIEIDGDLGSSYFAVVGSGWQFVSSKYPVNTWTKNIRTVVVEGSGPRIFRVISDEGDLAVLTPGEIIANDHLLITRSESDVSRELDGVVFRGNVLGMHRVVDFPSLLGVDHDSAVLAAGADGSLLQAAGGKLGLGQNYVYLYIPGLRREVELVGLAVDPPGGRVTDLYHEALELISDGHRVMAIMVDGMSHIQFHQLRAQGMIPNMASGEMSLALTVYPSITPVATAAMLTGKTPDQNGVKSRQDRQIQVPTIFDDLRDRGKHGFFVQGSIASLALGDELVMNTDRDGDGLIDDDVLESALSLVEDNPHFIFVHFKSTDDSGHAYGPLADETLDQFAVVDEFIGQLLEAWSGPVIILSDHGMHPTHDGGNHGEFRYEDMYVPYIRFYREGS